MIDTDPGVDDALAILMATSRPGVIIEALTVVAGNVSLEHTVRNACAVLDVAGVDAPVHAGAAGPLIGSSIDAGAVHGTDGLGDVGRSNSSRSPSGEHAVTALVRLATESPGELTLVALGPLTNIALATRLEPRLPDRYARVVMMGGAVRATGNSSAVAEFNVHADPEAAAIVLGAWPDVTLVSWEATLAHPLAVGLLSPARAGSGSRADFYRAISAHAQAYVRDFLALDQLLIPDPIAMAVALDPGIVRRAERRAMSVELTGARTRGQTVVDWSHADGGAETVTIVEEVDLAALEALVLGALA